MDNKTDKELYHEFLKGNNNAFDEIVKRYRKNLIAFILKYVKNYEIAEDLAQDTFVYILINRKEYDFKYSMKTYLYTIAKCRAINYIHKKKDIKFEESYIINQMDDKQIDDNLIREEEKKIINEAIEKLKQDYQIAIYLKDYQEFQYKEISKILNKTMPQTKMLIHRARKALNKLLKKEGYIC